MLISQEKYNAWIILIGIMFLMKDREVRETSLYNVDLYSTHRP